jgi:signal transduction histidine kinase
VLPFVIVALVATAGAAFVALSVTSEALQARLQSQLVSAARVISRGDLALNPAILQNLHEAIDAHIVSFDEEGAVVATTMGDADQALLAAASAAARNAPRSEGEGEGVETAAVVMDCGSPCLVALRPVEGRPGTVVALVAETSELSTATRAVARGILLAAAAGVVVMILVSQAVVRRVTAPLDRLVQFVSSLSPTDRGRRADVGQNEVGALAEAFNGMLDRLDASQDALVRSEKLALAGLLAARVAHDIRNPMSSIKMQTQLLRVRARGDADDEATLTAVLHDIDQVESVIRNLLELARPGELRLAPTGINSVIREAVAQLAAQFTHRKIAVELQLADAVPDLLLDADRVKQALLNLLVNASEALPSGGTITVTSRRDAAASLLVEVCDDGVGVDPAMLGRLFDPFVTTKRDGIGLGLVNAKAVIEGHGGRVWLSSRRPRGTCASISLPGPATGRSADPAS